MQDEVLDSGQAVADLEAEISALSDAVERCRKIIRLAKFATGAGGVLFLVTLTGLIRFGPMEIMLASR